MIVKKQPAAQSAPRKRISRTKAICLIVGYTLLAALMVYLWITTRDAYEITHPGKWITVTEDTYTIDLPEMERTLYLPALMGYVHTLDGFSNYPYFEMWLDSFRVTG